MEFNPRKFAEIPHTGHRYYISRAGDVYDTRTERMLKPYTSPNYKKGDLLVSLQYNGQYHQKTIAFLLAETYLSEPGKNQTHRVRYLNKDHTDIRLENLSWRTAAVSHKQKDAPEDLDDFVPVPGFEEYYRLHRDGRLYSAHIDSLVKPCMNSQGYPFVTLRRGNRSKTIAMHRLIALVFVPGKTDKKTHVKHLNGDRTDNRPENLAWVDAADSGARTRKPIRVWQHGKEDEARVYPSMTEAAKATGTSVGIISTFIHDQPGEYTAKGYCFALAENES